MRPRKRCDRFLKPSPPLQASTSLPYPPWLSRNTARSFHKLRTWITFHDGYCERPDLWELNSKTTKSSAINNRNKTKHHESESYIAFIHTPEYSHNPKRSILYKHTPYYTIPYLLAVVHKIHHIHEWNPCTYKRLGLACTELIREELVQGSLCLHTNRNYIFVRLPPSPHWYNSVICWVPHTVHHTPFRGWLKSVVKPPALSFGIFYILYTA